MVAIAILIFINRTPIHRYSKYQNTAQKSTFGSEFITMKTTVKLLIAFRFKLRCFIITLDQPTSLLFDNDTVCKNIRSLESKLSRKHNQIAFHKSREAVAALITRVAHEDSPTNFSDLFTMIKTANERERLLLSLRIDLTIW